MKNGLKTGMFSAFDSKTRRALAASISCISIVGIGLSLVIPLLALRLEAAGFPAHDNGLHIAVSGLATLVGAPLTPALARVFGVRPLLFAAIALGAVALLGFAFCDDYRIWLAIRAVFGLSLTVIFVVSEYWISAAAPPAQRGMALGLYATVLAVGFAIGPALLSLTGAKGLLPFLVAAGLVAAAAVPVALAGAEGAVKMEGPGWPNLRAIFTAAPLALAAGLLYGAFETGLNGLLPVFGLRAGFPPAWATFQLTLVAFGNVVFPVPIGMIADRTRKSRLLGVLALCGFAGALALPGFAADRTAYGIALFVWGGIVGGLYTVGLAILAEKFQGARLGAANAAYIMMYSLGMIVGPPALGVGLDLASPRGLFDALALMFMAYLALVVVLTGPFRLQPRPR
ncbi:MFS transporter [Rhodoblastus acidophilus]|uniref:MFS transporter n=1 Tax=Candidatus Rhodoblastus alkanivorans TaxID=2954117 RepID=A0ABS9Z7K4_9HYPH|nr:MFS transporter [Candidatus Rhodoblastus alkanivorans]MCI4679181.1 MFS transporter [Candidatus Rhodoblastus alkanivorans]MCI4683177.1 MFS transporter [Candidatus Rhodoblastus alkanivorans]MDI4640489.1 MFS transporter [Rhodoblastus acidophilus]